MHKTLPLFLLALIFAACKPEAVVPQQSTPVKETVNIFPDYTDIVIPCNIAPLNFRVNNPGEEFVARYATRDGSAEVLAAADVDGKLFFDTLEWHNLLDKAKGSDILLTLYAHRNGNWVKHPDAVLTVAEPIDPYLTYRLIEPSYELYRQLGLYQRNLTNFEEVPIYENNEVFESENNHCINCHAAQNYGETHRSLFHVRGEHGGTIFVNGDKAQRLNMKNDSILGNSVYPAWHPTQPWVVFSSNRTGQAFYMADTDKIEVIDYGSDLIFYDVEHNAISNVLKTPVEMETFPTWAPDGKTLYYCSAYVPQLATIPDSVATNPESTAASDSIVNHYNQVQYNLMALDFDPTTRTFSQPRLVFRAQDHGGSVTVPRVSSDGRWLVFTVGPFGQFHVWHKKADLYLMDLNAPDPAATVRPLTQANSPEAESFHSWSSNGRWLVFSSRRDDGGYTRPYITYIDDQGRDHKAFLLPQEDPEHHLMRMKSYNVPELSKTPVLPSPEYLRSVIYDDDNVTKVQYGK